MTDQEFLSYCEAHCDTPRAAFVPAQIARLHRMAGYEDAAQIWDRTPNRIMDGWKNVVLKLVVEAREKIR